VVGKLLRVENVFKRKKFFMFKLFMFTILKAELLRGGLLFSITFMIRRTIKKVEFSFSL